jgi:hypothetical protein
MPLVDSTPHPVAITGVYVSVRWLSGIGVHACDNDRLTDHVAAWTKK